MLELTKLLAEYPPPIWIKVHYGRSGKENSYLKPDYFEGLIDQGAIFIETNTIYGGERHEAIPHLKLADKHGFRPAMILADKALGPKITETLPGTVINAAHITGHSIMGLAACMKNLGMGLASEAEKRWVHHMGTGPKSFVVGGKYAQQAYRLGYMAARIEKRLNVVNIAIADEITADCDCQGTNATRIVLWKGLEIFEKRGATAKAIDLMVWKAFRGLLTGFCKASVVMAQFQGYDYGVEHG